MYYKYDNRYSKFDCIDYMNIGVVIVYSKLFVIPNQKKNILNI